MSEERREHESGREKGARGVRASDVCRQMDVDTRAWKRRIEDGEGATPTEREGEREGDREKERRWCGHTNQTRKCVGVNEAQQEIC